MSKTRVTLSWIYFVYRIISHGRGAQPTTRRPWSAHFNHTQYNFIFYFMILTKPPCPGQPGSISCSVRPSARKGWAAMSPPCTPLWSRVTGPLCVWIHVVGEMVWMTHWSMIAPTKQSHSSYLFTINDIEFIKQTFIGSCPRWQGFSWLLSIFPPSGKLSVAMC